MHLNLLHSTDLPWASQSRRWLGSSYDIQSFHPPRQRDRNMLHRCTVYIPAPSQPSMSLLEWNCTGMGWRWGSLWGWGGWEVWIHPCSCTPHPGRDSIVRSLLDDFRCLPSIYSCIFSVGNHFFHVWWFRRKLTSFWLKVVHRIFIRSYFHYRHIFFHFFAE